MTCPRGCNNRAELIPAYQELSASAIVQAAIRGNGSSLELGSVLEAAGAVPLRRKAGDTGTGAQHYPQPVGSSPSPPHCQLPPDPAQGLSWVLHGSCAHQLGVLGVLGGQGVLRCA